jgi:hypothetical protein
MKICDVCHQTVDRLGGGLKGMELLDCCEVCLHNLRQRITRMEEDVQQYRAQLWNKMLEDWRAERAAGSSPAV